MAEQLNTGQKRKRSDVDEADPKVKEFLEVMQPASKSKNWTTQGHDDPSSEPPTKIQAIEVPEAESDEEYEAVPKKSRQKSPPNAVVPVTTRTAAPTVPEVIDKEMVDSTAPGATDDDWLRGRTNRLLDLMDPEDIAASTVGTARIPTNAAAEMPVEVELKEVEEPSQAEEADAESGHEKPDPVIEAIQNNGRLFVRNLPYSASEDDLRKHFEPYGALEEVSTIGLNICFSSRFYDEYPDRDSLCLRAYDVNWTKILVDASYFLNGVISTF